mgnify:CR=1 FL=1
MSKHLLLNILDGVKVLDLPERLPGPFSSYVLSTMGADITKLENSDRGGDAFKSQEAKDHYPNFIDWYKQLNQSKKIAELSFGDQKEDFEKYIEAAQIIIAPENNFFKKYLCIEKLRPHQSVLFLACLLYTSPSPRD